MFFKKKSYHVQLKNVRSAIVYAEGDRRMEIDSEPASEEYDVIVYVRTMRWMPPHESEAVSSEDRIRIQKNIASELDTYRILWR